MTLSFALMVGVATVAVLIAVLIQVPELDTLSGATLGLVALVLLPMLTLIAGSTHHLARAKTVDFCGSCHVMDPYTADLERPQELSLAGAHHQNQWMNPERTCYECHTSYAMFGGLEAKWVGAKHLLVYYTGRTPEQLALYQPYDNADCLHCHGESAGFRGIDLHQDLGDGSCLECHGPAHNTTRR